MARRKKTSEDALASAVSLIAEHYDVACIVVPSTTAIGKRYTRWIGVGSEAAAEALLESAAKSGMTKDEAEAEA